MWGNEGARGASPWAGSPATPRTPACEALRSEQAPLPSQVRGRERGLPREDAAWIEDGGNAHRGDVTIRGAS